VSKILKGERPVIFGDGNQTRDYVFVKDVAIFNLMASEREFSGIYNVGTGIETSVNALFSSISKNMNASISPIYDSPRPGELRRSCLKIDKIRSTGWNFLPLEEGLKETIKWFRVNL
jgi:UDP-glucose 4-epimerase